MIEISERMENLIYALHDAIREKWDESGITESEHGMLDILSALIEDDADELREYLADYS